MLYNINMTIIILKKPLCQDSWRDGSDLKSTAVLVDNSGLIDSTYMVAYNH